MLIAKKRRRERVEEYRGVTVMATSYKIYAATLAERLRKEVERKEMMPPSQTGLRKGMGTIDNIYVLNYMINKQIEKKGGRLIAVFVDLKAAFNSVDRRVLMETMRKREVTEGLIERIEKMLREMRSRVRVGSRWGEVFGRRGERDKVVL